MADAPRTTGYSLWLEPEEKDRRPFQRLLEHLALNYSGPLFPFHVTLLGLPECTPQDREGVQAKVRSLAEAMAPFQIEFIGIGTRRMYFQSVFLMAAPSRELMLLNQRARELFGHEADDPYMPHGSLLYSNLDDGLRRDIVKEINTGFPSTMQVQAVSLYACNGAVQDWRFAERFPLVGTATGV